MQGLFGRVPASAGGPDNVCASLQDPRPSPERASPNTGNLRLLGREDYRPLHSLRDNSPASLGGDTLIASLTVAIEPSRGEHPARAGVPSAQHPPLCALMHGSPRS